MSAPQVNIHIAKAQFSELIHKVQLGEEVIIARNNKPVAKIIPFLAKQNKRRLGLAKGLVSISEDFEMPLEDFEAYVK